MAQWYQLYDPRLDEALADRLTSHRLYGSGLDDRTPYERTLWRLRVALAERSVAEARFAELNRQLEAGIAVLKPGTPRSDILVEAAVARPPEREGALSAHHPEGGFAWRGQRSFFGTGSHRGNVHKHLLATAHMTVNLGSDLIRAPFRPAPIWLLVNLPFRQQPRQGQAILGQRQYCHEARFDEFYQQPTARQTIRWGEDTKRIEARDKARRWPRPASSPASHASRQCSPPPASPGSAEGPWD